MTEIIKIEVRKQIIRDIAKEIDFLIQLGGCDGLKCDTCPFYSIAFEENQDIKEKMCKLVNGARYNYKIKHRIHVNTDQEAKTYTDDKYKTYIALVNIVSGREYENL